MCVRFFLAVGEGVEPPRSGYCSRGSFPEPSPPRLGGVSAKFHHPTKNYSFKLTFVVDIMLIIVNFLSIGFQFSVKTIGCSCTQS